jgi:hypothetical protein
VETLLGERGRKSFDSGRHEAAVVWVQPGPDGPPGFRGVGGYFHASESHVLEVHFARVGKAPPDPEVVLRLDALCRQTGRANDVAIIDRAFGGCALVARGVSAMPPVVRLDDLAVSSESWGRPQQFHAGQEDRAAEGPACEGDLMAVEIGVLRLTDLCHGFVREWMVQAQAGETNALASRLDEARAAIEKTEAQLEVLLAAARDEVMAKEEAGKSKRSQREERRAERERQRRRNLENRLRADAARLTEVYARLEREYEALESRRRLYSDDPYLLRAREQASAHREVDASPGDPL